jgi:hypothetical protein
MPHGKLMYFDGRCWTTKPMPPTDTPFWQESSRAAALIPVVLLPSPIAILGTSRATRMIRFPAVGGGLQASASVSIQR